MNNSPATKPGSSIKPGTIWHLGEHRLAFGDARDRELLKRLIGREKVNLICCDPPYAIAAVESKRKFSKLSKDKEIANDHLQSDSEYRQFTRAWLETVVPYLVRKNAAYIFNMDKMVFALREGAVDAGFKANIIIM